MKMSEWYTPLEGWIGGVASGVFVSCIASQASIVNERVDASLNKYIATIYQTVQHSILKLSEQYTKKHIKLYTNI